ncbi:hypothetical protein M408DRAFT_11518 [Serendipita vermifera MAFF 305830]|uniref:F-box domain-containing protein n=1 Tax=Serendipita vermifera MAFF 305830 TaxID=933852 RepID=A0A0C2X1R5_SERVB|nr:hypothetical protein M408DRAFT_11518 [Serendipita vermifera MAFF 305830]
MPVTLVPNQMSHEGSPVERLPTEILSDIFRFHDSGISSLLHLTHVCRLWRCTALGDASLWTEIRIPIFEGISELACDRFFDMLETQLDRTRGMLLDVTWGLTPIESFNRRAIDSFKRRDSISLWRTLCVESCHNSNLTGLVLDSADAFSQLECLRIVGEILPQFILNNMGNMAATKLWKLDLHDLRIPYDNLPLIFASVIHRITWIGVPSWMYSVHGLPTNVVNVSGYRVNLAHIAHAKACVLDLCIIQASGLIEFGKLTSLNIKGPLTVHRCEVNFPILQALKCSGILVEGRAIVNAPLLKNLRLSSGLSPQNHLSNPRVDWANNPRLNVWPKESLIVESLIPGTDITEMMIRSPGISRACLLFRAEREAFQVMERLSGVGNHTDEDANIQCPLCPGLSSLTLTFNWPVSQVDLWRSRATDLVEARKSLGVDLVIHTSWKGEGVNVRLA